MADTRPDKENGENGYRSILKGTSIFGGVQVFLILVSLIRGKFVALLLGPAGMGISSLFNSASGTIVKAASLGLNLAVVKEVAQHKDNPSAFANIMCVAFTLLRFTALLGALACALCSRWLSELTFHSPDYTWQFVLLAVAVYFTIAGNGQLSVLQGLHEVKKLSKASLVGAVTGLLAGVPLYYFFGTRGIVPGIVVLSLTTYIFYRYSLRHITAREKFNWQQHKSTARRLISLGTVLLAGDLIGTLATYILNIYLRSQGGETTVGLFQAATSIAAQYSGAITAALSLEYFPRLSKAASDNRLMTDIVNRQSEIVALAMAPLSCLMIISAPPIIMLLLSEEFMPVLELVRWMGFGIILRLLQFPMGYIAFAKGNRRVYFLMEGVFLNLSGFLANILFYHFFGLIGLGYAAVFDYVFSLGVYYVVNHRMYGYTFSRSAARDYLICPLLCLLCLAGSYLPGTALPYSLMGIFTAAAAAYALLRLHKLLHKL